METVELVPPAGALIQSLRSIGYTFYTAIADIVDNSIDAGAKNINVRFTPGNLSQFKVSIADDGCGMEMKGLCQAMSLGSKSPDVARNEGDLGRFGMGLKTASFSQAKKLSLVSKTADQRWQGLQWDLQRVADTNEWTASVLDNLEISSILDAAVTDSSLPQGTRVEWSCCDRLMPESADAELQNKIFEQALLGLTDHLGLVFHRFLNRKSRLKLCINGRAVEPFDPFCVHGRSDEVNSTLSFEETYKENIASEGEDEAPISVKGYLIPHPSRLKTASAKHKLAPHGDFLAYQGIYVYRGDRLLSWGDWYRLTQRSQANRLARVEIDIPNSLDLTWRLDIKKSKVELPTLFRNWLKPKVRDLVGKSLNTHKGRTSNPRLDKTPVWTRAFDRESELVTYQINKEHALVDFILGNLKKDQSRELEALIELIECSLPVDQISNDLGSQVTIGLSEVAEELPLKVKDLLTSLVSAGIAPDIILKNFASDSTFSGLNQKALAAFIEQLTE